MCVLSYFEDVSMNEFISQHYKANILRILKCDLSIRPRYTSAKYYCEEIYSWQTFRRIFISSGDCDVIESALLVSVAL